MTERGKGLTMREVEIGVFRPRPGDTFIIKSKLALSKEQKDHWIALMTSSVPAGVKVLLLDGDLELILIAPEAAAVVLEPNHGNLVVPTTSG